MLALTVVLGVIGLQAGHAAAPIVDLSLGTVLSEDFEEDNGGFTASAPVPPASSWQHGTPTSGPGVAASGTKVWATNLAGQYFASECQAILSPPIDLTSATTASVSFMEWRHIETSATLAFDAGRLYATADGTNFTLVDPAGGYTSPGMGTTARSCFFGAATGAKGLSGPVGTTPPAPVYTPVTADLTAFAGQTVRFAIMFASDSSVHRDGWYIDDFAVTIDGNTTTQDFEAGTGGFTVKNFKPVLQKSWSYGTPTTGPAGATKLWATNLDGNYGPTECSWVESPAFTVAALPEIPNELVPFLRAQLSWNQFFRSTSTGGGGVVQVGVDGAYTNIVPSSGYGTANPTSTLNACLQDDTQASGGFAGLISAAGSELTEYTADLTPYIGQTISLRFLFASTTSTLTELGWYLDDINVEMFLTVGEPELPTVGGTGAPGWTSGGDNSSWAYGVATAGPAGETAWGTNLAGNYNPSECSYIEAPELPGALVDANPVLTFDHWYEIESLVSTTTWDGAFLVASTDGGTTWTELTPDGGYPRAVTSSGNADGCKNTYGLPNAGLSGGVYGGNKTAQFDAASVSLASLAGAENVRIRFVFASDSSVHYDGWFVKNVTLGGIPLLPPTAPTV